MKSESKSVSYYVAYVIKKLWALVALSLVLVAVTISVARYSLPYMNDQKHHLEDWLSSQVGTEILIGEITAKWQGVGPAIVLKNVQLAQTEASPVKLIIAETAIEVDFWASIVAQQVQSNKFNLQGLELTLDLGSLRQNESNYPIVDALEHLFLQQLQLFSISDSKIILNTLHDQQVLLIDQVSWVNKDSHHQGVGQLQIEDIAKNSASFILDLYGGQKELKGTFFAKGEEVDLSPWVEQWMTIPHEIVESRGSFVMWAAIDNNSVQSIQLDLSNSRVEWNTPSSDIKVAFLDGKISASPSNNDWLFNLDNLTLQFNDKVTVTNWRGKVEQSGRLLLEHSQQIALEPLLGLLPLFLDQTNLNLIADLQPKASLDSLLYSHSITGEVAVKASISDGQWQQTEMLPGLQGLNIGLNWYNDSGLVSLKSKKGTLSVDKLLSHNIEYDRFFMDLYVNAAEQNFSISSENALFKSNLISLTPNLFYQSIDNYLAFTALIDAIDVTSLPRLYPAKLMGADTKGYLVDSLKSGKVLSASVLWHGTPTLFPFKKEQGVFQASVDITQGEFLFAPEWPAVTDLDLQLLFENESLYMHSQSGKLMDVELLSLSAAIPELAANAVLTIDATAQAIGPQVTDLMMQSNLADTLGQALQKIQIDGSLQTELNLHIPLTGNNVVAKGRVSLTDNQLFIPSLELQLEHTKGVVYFNNDHVYFNDVEGMLLDQPVVVSFNGSQQEQGYLADIQLSGDWQVEPLLQTYYPNLNHFLSGSSQWNAQIGLTLLSSGYLYNANIDSQLYQLDSGLPIPFGKRAGEDLLFNLNAQGNQLASTINASLGGQIEFNGNLPHKDMQFSRAHLAIGETELVGMGLGFSISANLPEIDVSEWYQVVSTLIEDMPEQGKPLLEAPKRIYIKANTAVLASQKLTDLDVVAKNTSESWLLDINAKQTRMEVALYKDWLSKGVNVNADFIQLAKWQSSADDEDKTKGSGFNPDINSLPPISFSCARCQYLESDLGKIDFTLSRSNTGMRIDNFRLKNNAGLFNGEGDWFLVKGQSSTRIKGDFSSQDFGGFLKGFNFNSGIKDSEASSAFDLSWQRAPYEFNFDSLNGQLEWHLTDGYLTEVTDKGSRIFSLLSLESIVRKLTLDFRDVFAKGFFYDKIDGSFQLKNGVADTQDIVVDGGAGEITMRGYTDLTAQQLNYRIEFAPKVTSSLPVIVAWMVNPATAIAALAIDQVLTSAKVISNIKFSLTGTLDNPQLKELGRDSKEVLLPARATPPVVPDETPTEELFIDPVSIQIPEAEPVNG